VQVETILKALSLGEPPEEDAKEPAVYLEGILRLDRQRRPKKQP
jgi:hypothetical protein